MPDKDKDKEKLPDNLPEKANDEAAPKKKKSLWTRFWKAWHEWWKLTFESYVVEVEDRILMSWKRIIKFCGITIIPILYGVICSVAMWNPVEALGKATTYVMDDDYSVLLVSDTPKKTDGTDNFKFGAVSWFNDEENLNDSDMKSQITSILTKGTGLKASDIIFDTQTGTIGIKNSAIKNDVEREKMTQIIFNNVLADGNKTAQFHLADGIDAENKNDETEVTYHPNDAGFNFQVMSLWDLFKQDLLNKKTDSNKADTDYKFSAPAFLTHPEVALQNIHYSTDTKWNDDNYKKPTGWIQARIPRGYTAKAISYIGLQMKKQVVDARTKDASKDTSVAGLADKLTNLTDSMSPLGLWTTYEKNFLFGYMFDMMSGLIGQYVAFQLPNQLNTAMVSNLSDYLTTSGPQIASLTNTLDKEIIINGDPIDYSKRYAISDSSYFTNGSGDDSQAQERLNSATIFGNVNGKDYDSQSSSWVGGKFINTINSLLAFSNSIQAKGLLGILGGQGMVDGIDGLVQKIQDLIKEIAGLLGKDRPTAQWHEADKDHNVPYVTYTMPNVIVYDGNTDNSALSKDFTLIGDDNKEVKNSNITYTFNKNANAPKLDDYPNAVQGSVDVAFDSPTKAGSYAYGLIVDVKNAGKTNVNVVNPVTFKAEDAGTQTNKLNSLLGLRSQPVKLADTSSTGIADDALVQLNKTVYQIVTGQHVGDTSKADAIIAKIWKVFGLKGNAPTLTAIGEMPGINIFDGHNILRQDQFDKNADKFVAANSKTFLGATTVNGILPALFNAKSNELLFGLKLPKLITYDIQGAEFGYEGIGLGVFFLTVGLFVGCILHSFIFDRAKRLTKAKWSNWYFSKYMLLLTVAFFQVTAEVWVVYGAGWHVIGASQMCYVWLWLLITDFMFTTIVQALWFSLKDEIIGKFLCVIVLVTSIAAGGGEFPPFSEFAFFHAISWVVPFTWVIQGFDEIAFTGPHTIGPTHAGIVAKNFGILWIYIALFLTLGMVVGAQLRMKEMDYGSHYGFAVAGAMRALGKDPSSFQVLKRVTRKGKKRYYYNWKSLPKGFDPELYFQCRKMYKFAGEFKWWQRKHHDFVQKPNYSDEEVVSRNE